MLLKKSMKHVKLLRKISRVQDKAIIASFRLGVDSESSDDEVIPNFKNKSQTILSSVIL